MQVASVADWINQGDFEFVKYQGQHFEIKLLHPDGYHLIKILRICLSLQKSYFSFALFPIFYLNQPIIMRFFV